VELMPYKDPARHLAYLREWRAKRRKERLEREKMVAESFLHAFSIANPASFLEVAELFQQVSPRPLTGVELSHLETLWRRYGKALLVAATLAWREGKLSVPHIAKLLLTVVAPEEVCSACGRPLGKEGGADAL